MSGIYPNSVNAIDYEVGQSVKWYVNEVEKSPYIGVVTEIAPASNKVYVEWPVGGNQQMDPTELMIVTPESDGISPVKRETGYSSYDKEISKRQFGEFSPKVLKLAEKLVASAQSLDHEQYKLNKMASNIAGAFSSEVVEKIASNILSCKKYGMSDIETYQAIYPDYESICSDHFMRFAVSKIYEGE